MQCEGGGGLGLGRGTEKQNTSNAAILFSVCVFIYKNIQDLEQTIRSIAAQKNVTIELLVSDDFSVPAVENQREKILKIIEPYRESFAQIAVNVNRERIGTVKHVNKIIHQSQGRYLCLLGSGDWLYAENVLADVVATFEAHEQYSICFSKTMLKLSDSKTELQPGKRVIRALQKGNDAILNLCCREVNYLTTIGSFFRRQSLIEFGGFDESYILLEDAPLFLEWMFSGRKIGFLDEITCLHEKGGVSNRKKTDVLLQNDSVRTLTEIKYPRRDQLDWFTRRVVIFKYYLRTGQPFWKKLRTCIGYPDAGAFMLWLIFMDWFERKRYFES